MARDWSGASSGWLEAGDGGQGVGNRSVMNRTAAVWSVCGSGPDGSGCSQMVFPAVQELSGLTIIKCQSSTILKYNRKDGLYYGSLLRQGDGQVNGRQVKNRQQ